MGNRSGFGLSSYRCSVAIPWWPGVGAGVTGACEPPDMNAKNRTQVERDL